LIVTAVGVKTKHWKKESRLGAWKDHGEKRKGLKKKEIKATKEKKSVHTKLTSKRGGNKRNLGGSRSRESKTCIQVSAHTKDGETVQQRKAEGWKEKSTGKRRDDLKERCWGGKKSLHRRPVQGPIRKGKKKRLRGPMYGMGQNGTPLDLETAQPGRGRVQKGNIRECGGNIDHRNRKRVNSHSKKNGKKGLAST